MSVVEGRREWLFLRVLLAAAVILGVILLQAGAREALAKNPETIMRANCSTCHGKKGEGGKSWITGKPAPKIAGMAQATIETAIRTGVAPHMPAFPVREISETEKSNLADYIAALPGSYISEPAYQHTVVVTDENPWYTPGQLEINEGDTVRWINKGKTYHPVTQADDAASMSVGAVAYAGLITDSGLLGPNGVFYRTFTAGGAVYAAGILYPATVVALANNLNLTAGDALALKLYADNDGDGIDNWADGTPGWSTGEFPGNAAENAVVSSIGLDVGTLRGALDAYYRGTQTFLCKIHPYMQGEIWIDKTPLLGSPLTTSDDNVTPTVIESTYKPSVYSGVYGVGEVWNGLQFYNAPLRTKDGAIQVIDAETWTVKSIIPVGNNPHNIWFSQGGKYALETSWFDNYFSIIDAKNKRVLKEVPGGATNAHVAANDTYAQAQTAQPYDNTKMFISIQGSNYVQEVINTDQDPSNWKLGATSPTSGANQGGFGPHGIASGGWGLSPQHPWVVTADTQNDTMSIFDADAGLTGQQITGGQVWKDVLRLVFGINADLGSIPLGAGITSGTVNVGGTDYQVAAIGNCLDGSVTIARRAYPAGAWTKVGDISVGDFPLRPCGIQVPFSPDDRFIVSVASKGLKIIDVRGAADPANYTSGVCGGIGVACSNANIVKATFDNATHTKGFGKGTHGAAFGPQRGGGYLAYVTHKFDNHMTVIDLDADDDNDLGENDIVLAGHIPLQSPTTVNTTTKANMVLYFNKWVPGCTGGNGIAARVTSDSPTAVKPKTQSRSGQVDVLFESTGFSHYRVYRHARESSYNANFELICDVEYNNSTGAIADSDCVPSVSALTVQPDINSSRYIVVRDQSVENWREYYYLVTEGPSYVEYNGDPADYYIAAAFPPNQTRHGSYTEFTGVCTNCHGLHSAQSSQKLLKGATVTDLCATCHDGSVSKYDAARGRVFMGQPAGPSDRYALAAAGPFGNQFINSTPGNGEYGSASSVHNVFRDGSTTGAYVYMAPGTGFREANQVLGNPGSGNDFSPVGWSNQLSCISCHEPHNRPFNFRLLRNDIADRASGAGSHGGALVVRGVSETGTISQGDAKWPQAYTDQGALVSNEVYFSQTKFFTGTAKFCSQCHRAFYNESVRTADRRELEKMFTLVSQSIPPAMTAEEQRHTIAFFDAFAALGRDVNVTTIASVYAGGVPAVVTSKCSTCHGIIYEAINGDVTITTAVYGTPVRLGWTTGNRALDTASGADLTNNVMGAGHRHPTQVPAYRVTFTGKVVEGALDNAGYSAGGQFQERVRPGPVHVGVPLEGTKDGISSYVENDVVCLTCHMSHGSRARVNDAADWAEWFTGDEAVGVAYRNIGMNGTVPESVYSGSLFNGYYYNAAPNYNPATPPAGPSTVLARFTPEASVCYRCHSTK